MGPPGPVVVTAPTRLYFSGHGGDGPTETCGYGRERVAPLESETDLFPPDMLRCPGAGTQPLTMATLSNCRRCRPVPRVEPSRTMRQTSCPEHPIRRPISRKEWPFALSSRASL